MALQPYDDWSDRRRCMRSKPPSASACPLTCIDSTDRAAIERWYVASSETNSCLPLQDSSTIQRS